MTVPTRLVLPPWTRREFVGASSLVIAGVALGCSPRGGAPGPGSGAVSGLVGLKPLLSEIVADLEKKFPYASALALGQSIVGIGVDDSNQQIDTGNAIEGVVFTVHNGAYFEEAATGDLDPDSLRRTARDLAEGVSVRPGSVEIDPGSGGDRHFRTACEIDPTELPVRERFDRMVALHERARRIDPELVNRFVRYREIHEDIVFVNRAKAWSQEILRITNGVAFVASDGKQTATDFDQRGGTGGLERVEISDDEIAALAEETRQLLSAGPVEPGEYTVVVDGATGGTVAHESFGHGVELDMFVKDRALAEEYVGKRVGSDLVDIYDDPGLEGAYGSYFFDHEGQPASRTEIVRGGIFRRGISDLMSATATDVSRSANGRRQDFTRKVYARMSNTFFGTGGSTLEGLIAGVDRGYLLQKLTHGMEDPKGWGIQLGVRIGREIRDGKLTGKLASPVGITGFVPDVLGSIDGVASDFVTDTGTCGKGHKEYVPVSTGGPHLRLRAQLS